MPVQKKQRKAKSMLKANLGSAFRCRNQSGAGEYMHGFSFRGAATATRQNKETYHKSKGQSAITITSPEPIFSATLKKVLGAKS